MFCENCGEQLPEETTICPKCNEAVTKPQIIEEKIEQNTTANRKWPTIVIGIVIGVLIIALAVLFVFILPNQEVNTFTLQVKNRNYHEAQLAYDELDKEERYKADAWMEKYISEIEENYYTGAMSYATSSEILKEMKQFDAVYTRASNAGENVYLDNQSAIALNSAKDLIKNKKWQEAFEKLQSIHIKYRLYDEVAALRTECATNYRTEVIEKMNTLSANGEIDKIIACRDDALLLLPDDMQIIQTSQNLLDEFITKTLSDAAQLAEDKDYTGAIELIEYAISMYNCPELWNALKSYEYDANVTHCEALAEQNDILGAVRYVKGLADADAKYQALLNEYAKTLVADTLATAKEYADSRQFQQAVDTIKAVQEVYDCDDFQNAIEEYNKYTPRKLSDCHVIDSDNVHLNVNRTDCFGKEYENVISCSKDTGRYVIFYLEGNFTNISGVFVGSDNLPSNKYIWCKIYADDEVIYESLALSRTSTPESINLDVTGVQQLRVVFGGYTDWTSGSIAILDLMVS